MAYLTLDNDRKCKLAFGVENKKIFGRAFGYPQCSEGNFFLVFCDICTGNNFLMELEPRKKYYEFDGKYVKCSRIIRSK